MFSRTLARCQYRTVAFVANTREVLNWQGSFDYAATRFAPRGSAQDDKAILALQNVAEARSVVKVIQEECECGE